MTPYYREPGIVIYHGDASEILGYSSRDWQIINFDAVLTDPPYGVDGHVNSKTKTRGRKNNYTQFTDSVDYVRKRCVPIIEQLVKTGRPMIMTPGSRCFTLYPQPDSFGAIYQPASVGLQPWGRADAQPILYYGPSPHGGTDLPKYSCSYQNTESSPLEASDHPCAKPQNLWTMLMLACSKPGDTILDPFMGSGSTLRAAKDNDRNAIGIEIEERYCEIAIRRLRQEVLF